MATRAMNSDNEHLLKRYAETGCEESFRTLVDQYAGTVYASALRRTGDRSLAEEATQRVFTILARKADTLKSHPALSGWLHTTTRLQCQSALRTERRHYRKLKALMNEPNSLSSDENKLDDRLPLLDEALDELSDADRRLILLRYVEKAEYRDIGRRLGKPEATCRKRVSRAIERLGNLLRRKDKALTSLAVTAALTSQLGKASGASLTEAITQQSLGNLAEVSFATILSNTIHTMAYTKTKTAAIVAAIASIPIGMQWNEYQLLKQRLVSLEQAQTHVENRAGLEEAPTLDGETIASAMGEAPSTELRRSARPKTSNWPGDRDIFALRRNLLGSLSIGIFDEANIQIDDRMKAVLELTPEETEQLEDGIRALRQQIRDHERSTVEVLEVAENRQAYYIPAFPELGGEIRESIEELAHDTLGSDRADFFMQRFSDLAEAGLRSFSRFGEHGRQIEFTQRDNDRIGVKVSHYAGEYEEGKHHMQRAGSYTNLPLEFRHLFRDEVSMETE